MLSKYLFIGAGGSGGATLRYVRSMLEERLQNEGYTGPFPAGWQFLHLDLLPSQDQAAGGDLGVDALPDEQYVPLATRGVTLNQCADGLVANQVAGVSPLLSDFAAWRPDPVSAPQSIWTGAGQFRAIGRTVVLNGLTAAADAIVGAIADLGTSNANSDMIAVSDQLGAPPFNPAQQQIVVVVVGSIAGGTGAGSVLDLCDVVRHCAATAGAGWLGPLAVLYAPDVFGEVGVTSGLQPNTLATLSELVAGYWNDGVIELPYHQAAGAGTILNNRHGPEYSILVGRSNNQLALESRDEVYEATASALAASVANETFHAGFVGFFFGNWPTAAPRQSSFNLHNPPGTKPWHPLSAMGYARAELGRQRFARYARERLTRRAADQLLSAHILQNPDVKAGKITPEQAITERLTRGQRVMLHGFLDDCRLLERTENDNQVLNALNPRAAAAGAIDEAVSEIVSSIFKAGGEAPFSVWLNRLSTALKGWEERVLEDAEARMQDNLKKWMTETQARVFETTAKLVAAEGLPVTIALLKEAGQDLTSAQRQLTAEETEKTNLANNIVDSVRGARGDERLPATNDTLQKALRKAASVRLAGRVGARGRKVASDAIERARVELIVPLTEALERALNELRDIEATLEDLPSSVYFPPSMENRKNEILLDPVSGYADTFLAKLQETVGKEVADPEKEAAQRLITGADSGGWSEVIDSTVWDVTTLDPLRVNIRLDLASLRSRSQKWLVHQRKAGIGLYISERPSSYLVNRTKDLSRVLTETLAAAYPLAALSNSLVAQVYPQNKGSQDVSYTMTPVPLAVDRTSTGKAYQGALSLLSKAGVVQTSFDAMADGNVEICGFFKNPSHPMVFTSLAAPIAAAAQQAGASNDQQFWSFRRARPLLEFIPLPRVNLEQLIRGWYVAMFLGRLHVEKVIGTSGKPFLKPELVVKATRNREETLAFPHPGLGSSPIENSEVLPFVLESYPLAEMLYTSDSRLMRAYEELFILGGSASTELITWFGADGAAAAAPAADADEGGTPQSPVAIRATKAADWFAAVTKVVQDGIDNFTPSAEYEPAPRSWELRQVILPVLADLEQECRSHAKATDSPQDGPAIIA